VPFPILFGTTLTTVLHYRADKASELQLGIDGKPSRNLA